MLGGHSCRSHVSVCYSFRGALPVLLSIHSLFLVVSFSVFILFLWISDVMCMYVCTCVYVGVWLISQES